MFGFLFGTACLIGLAAVLRRGHGCHRHAFGGWGRRHRGPHFFVHAVMDRLDTTPGQEKVIRGAVEEFVEEAREVKREFKHSRNDVAQALRDEVLDEGKLRDTFQRHDESIHKLREAAVRTLSKVHETLDERQRRTLSELLESGPFGWGFGAYRGG
jgi:Spy/CpxP family protein refolding chaperone